MIFYCAVCPLFTAISEMVASVRTKWTAAHISIYYYHNQLREGHRETHTAIWKWQIITEWKTMTMQNFWHFIMRTLWNITVITNQTARFHPWAQLLSLQFANSQKTLLGLPNLPSLYVYPVIQILLQKCLGNTMNWLADYLNFISYALIAVYEATKATFNRPLDFNHKSSIIIVFTADVRKTANWLTCCLDVVHYALSHGAIVENIRTLLSYPFIGVSQLGKFNDIIFLQEILLWVTEHFTGTCEEDRGEEQEESGEKNKLSCPTAPLSAVRDRLKGTNPQFP